MQDGTVALLNGEGSHRFLLLLGLVIHACWRLNLLFLLFDNSLAHLDVAGRALLVLVCLEASLLLGARQAEVFEVVSLDDFGEVAVEVLLRLAFRVIPLFALVTHDPVLSVRDLRIAVVINLLAEITILTLVVAYGAGAAKIKEFSLALGRDLFPAAPASIGGRTNELADLVLAAAVRFLCFWVGKGHAGS